MILFVNLLCLLSSYKTVLLFLLLLQTLDDEFLRNHTKVLLISDASDKIWEVKLDGNRLAGGWEEFAAVNNFSDGNVLVFRHNGDEIFHVAVSSDIQHASPSFTDTDDTEVDDEADGEDEDTEDDACKLFDVFYFFGLVRSGCDMELNIVVIQGTFW